MHCDHKMDLNNSLKGAFCYLSHLLQPNRGQYTLLSQEFVQTLLAI